AFIRRFLSLFFFNFVQFETGESFRGLARSSQAFEKHIEGLDRVCHQTVASIWKSFENTKRPLDLPEATELVRQIEPRLNGNSSLNRQIAASPTRFRPELCRTLPLLSRQSSGTQDSGNSTMVLGPRSTAQIAR